MDRSMNDLSIVDNDRIVISSDKEPKSTEFSEVSVLISFFQLEKCIVISKKSCTNSRAGAPAAIYCAAVLEYLTAELMQMAGSMCKEQKGEVITTRHLKLAIQEDEELYEFIAKLAVAQDPTSEAHIYEFLLSKENLGQSKRKMDVDLSDGQ
uniref:Histone H2A n=1 Tax=Ditylenchus dipsaci TaxID=166011 RepID=A0A915E991_9BILA